MSGILQLQKRTEGADDFLRIGFFVGFLPGERCSRPGKVLQENLPGAQRDKGSPGMLFQDYPAFYRKNVVLIGAVDKAWEQGQVPDGVIRLPRGGVRHGIDVFQIPVEPGTAVQVKGKTSGGIESLQRRKIVQKKNLADAVGVLRVLKTRHPFPKSVRRRSRKAEELPAKEDEQRPVKAVFRGCRPGFPLRCRELRHQLWGRTQGGRGQEADPVIPARVLIPAPKRPGQLAKAFPDLHPGVVSAFSSGSRVLQKLQPGRKHIERKARLVGLSRDRPGRPFRKLPVCVGKDTSVYKERKNLKNKIKPRGGRSSAIAGPPAGKKLPEFLIPERDLHLIPAL